jgi:hypothetical protein
VWRNNPCLRGESYETHKHKMERQWLVHQIVHIVTYRLWKIKLLKWYVRYHHGARTHPELSAYETTRRYIPLDSKLHTRRRENLKSHCIFHVPKKRSQGECERQQDDYGMDPARPNQESGTRYKNVVTTMWKYGSYSSRRNSPTCPLATVTAVT